MTDSDQFSDEELLAAHVAGDPMAFATLVRRHEKRLWAVALRTMRNPDDSADVLQEAMVSAFRRASSFRGDSAVLSWLHRIVVNAGLDRLRRNKVRRADPLPQDLDRFLDRTPMLSLDDRVAQRQLRTDIAAALDQLNPDQRAAIVLVDMQGYKVDEAASILGCAPGTIKSRCARGRARLVTLLDHVRHAYV